MLVYSSQKQSDIPVTTSETIVSFLLQSLPDTIPKEIVQAASFPIGSVPQREMPSEEKVTS